MTSPRSGLAAFCLTLSLTCTSVFACAEKLDPKLAVERGDWSVAFDYRGALSNLLETSPLRTGYRYLQEQALLKLSENSGWLEKLELLRSSNENGLRTRVSQDPSNRSLDIQLNLKDAVGKKLSYRILLRHKVDLFEAIKRAGLVAPPAGSPPEVLREFFERYQKLGAEPIHLVSATETRSVALLNRVLDPVAGAGFPHRQAVRVARAELEALDRKWIALGAHLDLRAAVLEIAKHATYKARPLDPNDDRTLIQLSDKLVFRGHSLKGSLLRVRNAYFDFVIEIPQERDSVLKLWVHQYGSLLAEATVEQYLLPLTKQAVRHSGPLGPSTLSLLDLYPQLMNIRARLPEWKQSYTQ